MRIGLSIPVVALLACMVAVGCGSKKDTSSSSDDGGLPADDSGFEAPPPSPGTCHRMCCTNSDCSLGQTCTPFDPSAGTLGVCMGPGGQSDGGTPTDGGTPPIDGGSFDNSCWSLNATCNPLTNSSCAAGGACDISGLVPGSQGEVDCQYGDNVQGDQQVCDSTDGPFCIGGYHCVPDN